jgi:hypothetical protein
VDANDLDALRTVPMTRYPQENNGTNVDLNNRKMVEKDVGARKMAKGIRRAKATETERHLKEKDKKKGVLTGEEQNLANALNRIGELGGSRGWI